MRPSSITLPSKHLYLFVLILAVCFLATACHKQEWPPQIQTNPKDSPILSPEEALDTFFLPPGYDIELVASEPRVIAPVAMDFDADGRLWVVEMPSFMPNTEGKGENKPTGRIVVLEDTTGDGKIDNRTVFLDNLVLPRAIKVLDNQVLVGAPPFLYAACDTTGNLQADTVQKIRDDFGDSSRNPEHNSNGLMWGIDNWIHNTGYEGRFRVHDDQLQYSKVPSLGQWGITMDNHGRIYRNNNSNPLYVDYISPHYYMRNKDSRSYHGIYESISKNKTVWPVHPTPGVNRGYREGVLRDDGTLAHYTAGSSLAAYRGDRLPEELLNNIFVPEPAGNLIQRLVVKKKNDGTLLGYNPYEDLQTDFLTSTDERFRPVNIYSAPDGTLYILDMYRGIIQHKTYLTDYLRSEIEHRGLEEPLEAGRIYRITHKSNKPGPKPQLSSKKPGELISALKHPNGWWRDTAQRLLVERQPNGIIPKLRELVTNSDTGYVRLHALWTLDGLDKADRSIIESALSDPSPHIRAAAIRMAEPILAETDSSVRNEVMKLITDSSSIVQRQLAASVGEFPLGSRIPALIKLTKRYGNDPIIRSLVISGLSNHEFNFLDQLYKRFEEDDINMISMAKSLANVLFRTDSHIDKLLNRIGDKEWPKWKRNVLLTALEEVAPKSSSNHYFKLNQQPTQLLAVAKSENGDIAKRINSILDRLSWPGKPKKEPKQKPLSAKEKKRFSKGRNLYEATCASCHRENGKGFKGMGANLVESKWVIGDKRDLIRILLNGKKGEKMQMPAFKNQYSDKEIASILTYLRRAWRHEASPVHPPKVKDVRGATSRRKSHWTEEELKRIEH